MIKRAAIQCGPFNRAGWAVRHGCVQAFELIAGGQKRTFIPLPVMVFVVPFALFRGVTLRLDFGCAGRNRNQNARRRGVLG